MDLTSLKQTVDQTLTQANADLDAAQTADALERFRVRYLGGKGVVKELMSLLGQLPREEKPAAGQLLNHLKTRLTEAFEARSTAVKASASSEAATSGIDLTEPGRRPRLGRRHVLMTVIDELTDLFARMGFAVAAGPEVEDEFHNFIALNIPAAHPARDPLDNFYLSRPDGSAEFFEPDALTAARLSPDNAMSLRSLSADVAAGEGERRSGPRLLRTQTSTVQIRVMESQPPPIRVVIPGRVYRPDTHDDTHLSQFHQLEALVVDRNVTLVDLKSTVLQFVHAYFGPGTRVRFRPSFFPFTEPSAEVDVYFEDKGRWIELGGCGMVHPNVLRACKIDPEQYTGWAFGFGIERIAMRKYGIHNIRLFVENDVRFLSQF